MENQRSFGIGLGAIIVTIVLFAGLAWANFRFASAVPGGNDFLPRWMGTRQFLLRGQSPYSVETTRQIQREIYGRRAQEGEDQHLFLYPFYSILVFLPFAMISDFVAARAAWMAVLELALLGIMLSSVSLSKWRVSPAMLAVLLLFSLFGYHGARAVINGNPAVLSALFITLAFLTIRSKHDVWAGFFLALATIKPQMVVLLVIFVLYWAMAQRRSVLFWAFLGTLGILVASTSLILPSWIRDNIVQLFTYSTYMLPNTIRTILRDWMPGIGGQIGIVLAVFVLGILIGEWRAASDKEFQWFFWTANLTLVATNLVGIQTNTDNYLALLPGLVLVLTTWDERWGKLGRWMILISLVFLFGGLWLLFFRMIEPQTPLLQHSLLYFPVPFFILVGLYWVRWWAIRPPRLFMEELAVKVD